MSWSNNLWDCKLQLDEYFDVIFKNMDNLAVFFDKMGKCEHKIHQKQNKYFVDAKDQFIKDIHILTSSYSSRSVTKSLNYLLSEHQFIINQTENLSEISKDLCTSIKSKLATFSSEKNKIIFELKLMNEKAMARVDEYFQAKTAALLLKKKKLSKPNSKNKGSLFKKSLSLTPLSDMEGSIKNLDVDFAECLKLLDQNYIEICEYLENYSTHEISNKFNELEDLNSQIIEFIKSAILDYLKKYKEQIWNVIGKCLDSMIQNVESINPETENRVIKDSLITGYKIPCTPKEFQHFKDIKNLQLLKKISDSGQSTFSDNIRKINYDIDLTKIPPAKMLTSINRHLMYLYNEMKNIDKQIIGTRKMVLTVGNYGGSINEILNYKSMLEGDYDLVAIAINKYSHEYIRMGGFIEEFDVHQQPSCSKVYPKNQEHEECDKDESKASEDNIILLKTYKENKSRIVEDIPSRYFFPTGIRTYELVKDYNAQIYSDQTTEEIARLSQGDKFFVKELGKEYTIAIPLGVPDLKVLIKNCLLKLIF